MPPPSIRLALLASGDGSNVQAILDYFDALGEQGPAKVVLVASDRAQAGALQRAARLGVPTAVIERPADEAALAALLERHQIDLVALAGYLKYIPAAVTKRWSGAIVNVHPALLPKFGGAGMYGQRVHLAVLAAGEVESGATVHEVDEEYDHGRILGQERVPVERGDTAAILGARVLAAEHRLYPRTLHALALQLTGRS